jgi:hypothetical protein
VSHYVQTSLIGARVRYSSERDKFPWWPFESDEAAEAQCVGVYIGERGAVLLVRAADGRVGETAIENVTVCEAASVCGCPVCGASHVRGPS